jgi:hypothetical protein
MKNRELKIRISRMCRAGVAGVYCFGNGPVYLTVRVHEGFHFLVACHVTECFTMYFKYCSISMYVTCSSVLR